MSAQLNYTQTVRKAKKKRSNASSTGKYQGGYQLLMSNFLLAYNILFWHCPVDHIQPDCCTKKVKACADNHLQMLYDVGPTWPAIYAQTKECIRPTSLTPTQIYSVQEHMYTITAFLFHTLNLLLLPFVYRMSALHLS